jgi:hypothetical protein
MQMSVVGPDVHFWIASSRFFVCSGGRLMVGCGSAWGEACFSL